MRHALLKGASTVNEEERGGDVFSSVSAADALQSVVQIWIAALRSRPSSSQTLSALENRKKLGHVGTPTNLAAGFFGPQVASLIFKKAAVCQM